MSSLRYIQHYSDSVQQQVQQLIQQNRLADWLLQRYPEPHRIHSAQQLYDYCQALKQQGLQQSPPLHKVRYDDSLQDAAQALGQQIRRSSRHGSRLKSQHEIRIAGVFRRVPEAFLKMILAHELAHLREPEHNKAFYRLCEHLEPDYHQYEFDLRLYLIQLELGPALY